ncbi:hypothetical protein CRUP_014363 [Coryphaenoides rupestris]|nr:hypothetical protein CRUP_014363 [Coryphaenoides rupestris]
MLMNRLRQLPNRDLDFIKASQIRSPDYHLHQQPPPQPPQQQRQQQEEEEEEEEEVVHRSGPPALGSARGYSLGVSSDVDTEPEVEPSPAHGLQHMWMRGLKSEQSSCMSSRANSALSLTDTEHDRKSEADTDGNHCCRESLGREEEEEDVEEEEEEEQDGPNVIMCSERCNAFAEISRDRLARDDGDERLQIYNTPSERSSKVQEPRGGAKPPCYRCAELDEARSRMTRMILKIMPLHLASRSGLKQAVQELLSR